MSVIVVTSLIATLFVVVYLYVKSAFSYWKRRGVPYIEPSFPFGNFKDIFLQKLSFAEGIQKLHETSNEPVVGVYAIARPCLLIRDTSIARDILIKNFANFSSRGLNANEKVDPMSNNILLQNGEKWRTARTGLSPAFTSGKLKGMFDSICGCAKPLNEYVGKYANQNKTIEIREASARYATNVIASVAFGISIDCIIDDPDSAFRKYGKRLFDPTFINAFRNSVSFLAPKLAKVLGVRFIDKDVGDFMIATVKQNLEYRENNDVQRNDLFQLLIQLRNSGKIDEKNDWSAHSFMNGKALSVEEMSAQAFLFFAGGYESSSTTISFCLYELARQPDIQQKAYEDITSSLEKHNGQLTYDSINDMKFVENCIQEILRMHAPFGMLGRECIKDYKIAGSDVVVEKGTTVFISVNGIQNDPKYYNQPDKFMPQRFEEKRIANTSSGKMPFLTFGDGPRNCLGLRLGKLQSKLAVVTLLQKYRFELGEEHINTPLKMIPQSRAKCPENGINLKVFTR